MIFASPRYMRDCIYSLARSAPANEPYPGIVLTVVSSKLLSLPQAHLNTAAGQLAGTVSPVLQPVSLTLSFNTPNCPTSMSEIYADGGPLPHVPDDWTIEQFVLDGQHPVKPQWYDLRPVLIDEITGREMGSDEVSTRL